MSAQGTTSDGGGSDKRPPLSYEEAVELFSDAYDGELDEETQARFDAALAADEELAEEYAEFATVLDGTHSLNTGGTPPPDLLKGIQRKIRERSNGRFFRDHYSSRQQVGVAWLTLLLAAVMFLLAGAAYFGLYYIQAEQEAQQPDE